MSMHMCTCVLCVCVCDLCVCQVHEGWGVGGGGGGGEITCHTTMHFLPPKSTLNNIAVSRQAGNSIHLCVGCLSPTSGRLAS